jgi:regulator of replication initiation timing
MIQIEPQHLQYLLKEVEEMHQHCTYSIETNPDIRYLIDKLNAILAARVALGKGDYT